MGAEFGQAAPMYALRYGSVLVLFLLVLLLVWRRSRRDAPENRMRGILLSALVVILGFPLYLGGLLIVFVPVLILLIGFVMIVYLVIPAFLSAALADVCFRALGAERSPFWLAAGIVAAIAITIIWIGLVLPGEYGLGTEWLVEYAVVALVPVSSALVWWSYLPVPPGADSKTFD